MEQQSPSPTPPNRRWNPIPIGNLTSSVAGLSWVWEGMLAHKRITLMSAQAKAGKTTLLSLLFHAMEKGGVLLGTKVNPGRVIILTEETADQWIMRREALDLANHIECICLPFLSKPKSADWLGMLREGYQDITSRKIDLAVFDTLSHLWPVTQENDNSALAEALMPIRHVSEAGAAVLLMHHSGAAGERSRGGTELEGFVDQVTHIEKVAIGDLDSRKRIIQARGRLTTAPVKLTVSLNNDGTAYQLHSGFLQPLLNEKWVILQSIVPREPPGATITELRGLWPELAERVPTEDAIYQTVTRAYSKAGWKKTDTRPARYWWPFPNSQPLLNQQG